MRKFGGSGLEGSVGFALGVTYRRLSQLFAIRIRGYGLTPEQWSVLDRIATMEGQMQKDIGRRAGKDKPTTTRILDLLESKGWIVRKPGAEDRRAYAVYLTEEGRRTWTAIGPIERATVADACRGISPEEYDLMLKLLSIVWSNADALASELETE